MKVRHKCGTTLLQLTFSCKFLLCFYKKKLEKNPNPNVPNLERRLYQATTATASHPLLSPYLSLGGWISMSSLSMEADSVLKLSWSSVIWLALSSQDGASWTCCCCCCCCIPSMSMEVTESPPSPRNGSPSIGCRCCPRRRWSDGEDRPGNIQQTTDYKLTARMKSVSKERQILGCHK